MDAFPVQSRDVFEKVIRGKLNKAEAARRLGISRRTLYRWLTKYESKTKEYKKSRNKYKNEILQVVITKHSLGPKSISRKLRERGILLSPRSVWLVLRELNLSKNVDRENYALKFRKSKHEIASGYLRLNPQYRKRMIEDVLYSKRKASEVTKELGISRKTFAKWKKRYLFARENNLNLLTALADQHPLGAKHPSGTNEQAEKRVLNLVIDNPELSSQKIASRLRFIGNHGVQNVLSRNNLNLYEHRLAYSKAQKAVPKPAPVKFIDRVRHVLEQFVPTLAPAPPPVRKIVKPETPRRSRPVLVSLRSFVTASVITFITIYALLSWVELVTFRTGSTPVGAMFVTIAFASGMLFFLYSLKYYVSLAIVLSFSQQEGLAEETSGRRRKLLPWILGGDRGRQSTQENIKGKAVGLTPNLENVSLQRYPYVSINIPFFNEKRVVERSIIAATSMDYQGEYEVILCDDSTDETTAIIRNYQKKHLAKGQQLKVVSNKQEGWTLTSVEVRPGVTLKHLHRTSRSGFKGGALGVALKLVHPKTEFVSVFDADFVPYPDTLEQFLKYFQVTTGSLDRARYSKDPTAVIQGYQWHVLNKSENWVTRGVRAEYSGSYVIERSGTEIYGGLKMISGAVYMIRRDVLDEVGWQTSITEDFELTLRLYEKGYKVVYTPYIQAPAECVSTVRRLIRQRMRWAEGHSNNVKKMFWKLIKSKNLTVSEKFEFLYLTPYYLQALFFLVGTMSWLISETIFPANLPFWTDLWGWSLVLTNLLALPLMNSVGMFLEESEERDYTGLASFIALTYLMVPFQAYAAVKGFLESEEGTWFRTPKTGRITDVFKRGTFYRFISGILPGRKVAEAVLPVVAPARMNPYLSLATSNNQFNSFNIKPRRKKWLSKAVLSILLVFTVSVYSFTKGVPEVLATPINNLYMSDAASGGTPALTGAYQFTEGTDADNSAAASVDLARNGATSRMIRYVPGGTGSALVNSVADCTDADVTPSGEGWIYDTTFESTGSIASGNWTFEVSETDNGSGAVGYVVACPYIITVSGGSISTYDLINEGGSDTSGVAIGSDTWDGTGANDISTVISLDSVSFSGNEYLYVEYWNYFTSRHSADSTSSLRLGTTSYGDPGLITPDLSVPEKAIVFLALSTVIPYMVIWMKKRKKLAYA